MATPVKNRILMLVLLLPALAAAQSIPPPRYLTDEEQIRIILQRIEQGIKDQDILAITDGFARVYNIDGTPTARFLLWEQLRDAFDRTEARREDSLFQALTPPQADLTSTWDFELEIDTVQVLGGGQALAHTWIYLGAAQPDSTSEWRFGRKQRENIRFQKIDGEWRVVHLTRLFENIISNQD